jgi:hypothetical protein
MDEYLEEVIRQCEAKDERLYNVAKSESWYSPMAIPQQTSAWRGDEGATSGEAITPWGNTSPNPSLIKVFTHPHVRMGADGSGIRRTDDFGVCRSDKSRCVALMSLASLILRP